MGRCHAQNKTKQNKVEHAYEATKRETETETEKGRLIIIISMRFKRVEKRETETSDATSKPNPKSQVPGPGRSRPPSPLPCLPRAKIAHAGDRIEPSTMHIRRSSTFLSSLLSFRSLFSFLRFRAESRVFHIHRTRHVVIRGCSFQELDQVAGLET